MRNGTSEEVTAGKIIKRKLEKEHEEAERGAG